VDVGFRLVDRDKRVAAAVLSGGLAFRFFFWALAFVVFVTGGLGLGDGRRVATAVTTSGLDPDLANALVNSWESTKGAQWWLLLVGGWLVLWTGYLAVKALVLVHAAVWGVPPPPARNPLRGSLAFTAGVVVFGASVWGARWAREHSLGLGLLATFAVILIPFAMWLLAAQLLPREPVEWRALVPGAVLFAVGVQALHLFTVFYLSPKLHHSTQLYGVLGIVATLLFWLYMTGRLVVAAATLNASLHEQRALAASPTPAKLPDAPDPDLTIAGP
jgi:uncharacterized BrkB/YihY/UPF0761 family membrane protein